MMASVEIGARPHLRCTNYNDSLADSESALLVEDNIGQSHPTSTDLLVDGSTPMFSRQLLDSAEALL